MKSENGDGAEGGMSERGFEKIGEEVMSGDAVGRDVWKLDPIPEKGTRDVGEEA